jgi:hypothetical protein
VAPAPQITSGRSADARRRAAIEAVGIRLGPGDHGRRQGERARSLHRRGEKLLRHLQHHRSRPARQRALAGGVHVLREALGARHRARPLHDRRDQRVLEVVGLRFGLGPGIRQARDQHQHRRGGVEGVAMPMMALGRPWSAMTSATPTRPGDARIAVGGADRAGLVAAADDGEAVALERIEQEGVRGAGEREHRSSRRGGPAPG